MAIKKGTTSIGKVYVGNKEIDRIYKGSTLVYQNILLPREYQQVEYLESTGTQYIDTGVQTSTNIEIIAEMKISQIANDYSMCLFGSWNDNQGFRVYRRLSDGTSRAQYANIMYELTNIDFTQKHKIDFNKKDANNNPYIYIDDVMVESFGSTTFSNSLNICAFVSYSRDSSRLEWENNGKTILYSLQLYNNGTIIRNYIPCYRKIDGVAGLYDLVNGVFYTNAGTGEFVCGHPILSDDYDLLEYIESSGTQYIDTGAITSNVPNYSDRVSVSLICRYTEIDNTFRQGRSGNRVGFGILNNQFYFGITNENLTLGTADTNKHTFFINTNDLSYGYDNNIAYKSQFSPLTTNSGTFYLFARNGASGAENFSKCAVYKCSIKINNEIVRDFVPVVRLADNTIGLYDIKNDVFYTNAGSGTFTKGDNV